MLDVVCELLPSAHGRAFLARHRLAHNLVNLLHSHHSRVQVGE
jgi:hypothetical protein